MTSEATPNPAGGGGGMLCPRCRVDLVMSERQGVEIDYCPRCRGVWLDRGEIDKIVERSMQYGDVPSTGPAVAAPPPAPGAPAGGWTPPPAYPPPGYGQSGYDPHHGGGQHSGGHHSGGYGQRSWLGRLFHH